VPADGTEAVPSMNRDFGTAPVSGQLGSSLSYQHSVGNSLAPRANKNGHLGPLFAGKR
jgi:hypothetical protein